MPDPGAVPPRPITAALDAIRCSFCGKRGTEVEAIVAGPTPSVAICNECLSMCTQIVDEQRRWPGGPGSVA